MAMSLAVRIPIWGLLMLAVTSAYAGDAQGNPRLFHYREFMNAQFSCDARKLEALGLDPKREYRLAPRAWSVISDLKIEERAPIESRPEPHRAFRVSFRGLGYFECGQTAKGLESPQGELITQLPIVRPAWERPQFTDVSGDDKPPFREGWSNYDNNEISTDMPAEPGTRGWTCLADQNDVLRDPSVIDLDKLCEGRSAKEREFTKKEIERAIKIWKTAREKK